MSPEEHTNWTTERLEQLIRDQIEEGPQLDYKAAPSVGRSDSRKAEITKDVSAFANSNGGTIIYGIREFADDARKHLPECIDPIDGRDFSREWMDQVVGQIVPRIQGVRIEPIRVGPDTWQVSYVIEIPRSELGHQARDFKYYRRYNFESGPMADYEVRDVMNRRKHPHLSFKVKVVPFSREGTVQVFVRIWNEGTSLGRHYAVQFLLPPKLIETWFRPPDDLSQLREGFFFWRLRMGGSSDMPLFPGSDVIYKEEFRPLDTPLTIPHPPADYLIARLFADEMPFVERRINIADAVKDWA